MGSEAVFLLLVDEAGQACLDMRSARNKACQPPSGRRSHPGRVVETVDGNADAKLAERRGAPDRHRATRASAQTLAMRQTRSVLGLAARRESACVGCPLKVHRRCVEPMFGLSNRLAYDSGMVLAEGKAEEEEALTRLRPLLGESRWFDVAARQGGPKHFIREQAADIVRWLVGAYAERKLVGEDGLPALFVISPFRSMADGVRKALCDELKAQGHDAKAVNAWGAASVGTVHTFQGKERETVILALGGASDGAIGWACGTPNILNVAVTRAQHRLYVVGDRARWMAASSLVQEFSALPVEDGAAAARSPTPSQDDLDPRSKALTAHRVTPEPP